MGSKGVSVSGLHSVTSLLKQNPGRIVCLRVFSGREDRRMQTLLQLASEKNIPVEKVSRDVLDTLAASHQHQGVVAECRPSRQYVEADLPHLLESASGPPLLLVLDGVQDPHNLGACLRSSDAAGVTAVIAPKDRSVSLTDTAIRVASGAAEHVPFVQVTNLARTLRFLKDHNVWVYGAAAEGEKPLYAEDLSGPVALVMGSEGAGLRRLTAEACDGLLKIPLAGSVSSLNVSVAAGIFLFEAVRQRSGT